MNVNRSAVLFEQHRRVLEGLAYRMLGTLAEAQDVVQDTYLKWQSADLAEVRDPRAWLVAVCSRLSLNALSSARRRRETYVGTWLPEPLLAAGPTHTRSAAEQLEIDESVSFALLVALERLSPDERAAFLLHDVFGHDFDELAAMLGKSSAACRKLASRARARVRADRTRFDADACEHRRLVSVFFAALHAGDARGLEQLLCTSVELHIDGGGKAQAALRVVRGRGSVRDYLLGVWQTQRVHGIEMTYSPSWFNGAPGALVFEDGRLTTALCMSVGGGEIAEIYAQRNPDKLVRTSLACGPVHGEQAIPIGSTVPGRGSISTRPRSNRSYRHSGF